MRNSLPGQFSSQPAERIVALVGPPSPRSMGPVAFITQTGRDFRVHGLSASSAFRGSGRLDPVELVRTGHAMAVAVVVPTLATHPVAWWVGREFRAESTRLGLGPPEHPHVVGNGQFRVASASLVVSAVDQWVRAAFGRFIDAGHERASIARLMRWTYPDHPKTLAAWWASSPVPDRAVAWQLRLYGCGETRDEWIARLEETLVRGS